MASGQKQIWRAVLAALVVAGGVGVAWAVGLRWLDSLEDSLLSSRDQVYEDIYIAVDGTPVISVQSNTLVNTATLSRRTLDGKPWSVDYEHWLGGAYLGPRNLPPGLVELPLEWNAWGARMIGGTDGRRPPTAWYVIRDAKLVGHCYLAGYDAFSKLPVGYLSRNGFRATAPALADQFKLPATYERRLRLFAATSQYLNWGIVWDHNLHQEGNPAPWLIFMLEADRLWEVDLRLRTSRVVLESPGSISTTSITALKSTVEAPSADGEAANLRSRQFRFTAANMQDPVLYDVVQSPPASAEDEKPKFSGAIAVRTNDKIVLYHSPSGNEREFKLPKSVPNQGISAYWIAPNQLILHYDKGHWSGGPIHQLMWIDAAGKIEREEEVKLAGRVPEPPRRKAWKASALIPVPVLWLIGMVLGAPLYAMQMHFAADYASALALIGSIAWPPLIVVLTLSLVFAWLTLRLQRKYDRPATAVWTAFVFLLGAPGFVAYWLEHRCPPVETCRDCGRIVPRDRDVCAVCNTRFPESTRVATEIFA